MNMTLTEARTTKYAWPGGYPVYIMLKSCELVCHDCYEVDGIEDEFATTMILWEGVQYCAYCEKKLESAYGDGDE